MIFKGQNKINKMYFGGDIVNKMSAIVGDEEDKAIFQYVSNNAAPYDAEIEYLESTGTQYINTNKYLNTSNFEIGYETNGKDSLFGYCHQNVGNGTWIGGEDTRMFFGRFGNSYSVDLANYLTSSDNTVVFRNNGVTVNGTTISKTFSIGSDSIANIPLMFFARYDFYMRDIEIRDNFYPKFKSFYLKNNGELVLDLIAVRVGQVGYMYDKVSGQLFGNDGTGSFILGADK